MQIESDVVAIGFVTFDGKTRLVEIKSPRELKGRTLDHVVFVQEVTDIEWIRGARCATAHSTASDPITKLLL